MRDVGSLNGTYVNRELIDEAALRSGDEVQIGKFRLVYYSPAARCPERRRRDRRARRRAGGRRRRGLDIGEVLAALRRDFPDVTISKIRFLEAEGLVRRTGRVRLPDLHRRTTSTGCATS